MTTREKIGLGIVIALFVFFGLVLYWTVRPAGDASGPEDSVFIQQRMKNLQKD